MAHVHCIPKVKHTHTHTHSVFVIIIALHQCLQERASVLHYTYNSSLILNYFYHFTAFITSSIDNRGPCEMKRPFNLAKNRTTT
jgi:hypothetical protein